MTAPTTALHPRFDPRRRCIPLAEWPREDRLAWEMANRSEDLLVDVGLAASWRPASAKRVIRDYGRWLTFIQFEDGAVLEIDLADRVTHERIARYIETLRSNCLDTTVAMRIEGLLEALRVMSPEHDWAWLRKIVCRLRAGIRSRREKESRIRSTAKLFELGAKLMEDAELGRVRRPSYVSVQYRDGLAIAMLALRPLRLKNYVSIGIGDNLYRSADGYWLFIPSEEAKGGRPIEMPVPEVLVDPLDRYLDHHRPRLLGENASSALWITREGQPMRDGAMYSRITKLTREEFGVAINPPLFRDCCATSIAIDDPENVWMAATILPHSSADVMNRYYNQAKMISASRMVTSTITELREQSLPERQRKARGANK